MHSEKLSSIEILIQLLRFTPESENENCNKIKQYYLHGKLFLKTEKQKKLHSLKLKEKKPPKKLC